MFFHGPGGPFWLKCISRSGYYKNFLLRSFQGLAKSDYLYLLCIQIGATQAILSLSLRTAFHFPIRIPSFELPGPNSSFSTRQFCSLIFKYHKNEKDNRNPRTRYRCSCCIFLLCFFQGWLQHEQRLFRVRRQPLSSNAGER